MIGWSRLARVGSASWGSSCSVGRRLWHRGMTQGPSADCTASIEKALTDDCGKNTPKRCTGVHVFRCSDQLGIVATISQRIARRGANILNVDIYIDFDNGSPIFYSRSEFSFDPAKWPRDEMEEDFAVIGSMFKAETSIVRVPKMDKKMKTVILASKQ